MKGFFISLEGPDGSGKSTQSKLLLEFFRKKKLPVLLTREPGGSPIAEHLRKVLLSENNRGLVPGAELLLFEACRNQHVNDTLVPALKAGKIVLCDRFIDSTFAYQAYGRGFPQAEVEWLNRFGSQGLKPNLTLLFDLAHGQGLKRASAAKGHKPDRMELSGQAFHARVRQGYLAAARKEPRRIKVLDVTGKNPQEVFEQALGLLQPILKRQGYAI